MCDRWSRYAQLMKEGEEKLLMRMLRPFDADLADGPMQMTIAHLAAEYGQVWMLKELHAQGVRLNRVTARGDTIAHIAARNGQHEVLAWLASLGTNCPDLWLELPQITYRAGIALEHILHAARPTASAR